MLPHAMGHYFDGAFRGEDDHEDHLDALQAGVQLVAVSMRVGRVESQRDTRGQNGDEDEVLEHFPFGNLDAPDKENGRMNQLRSSSTHGLQGTNPRSIFQYIGKKETEIYSWDQMLSQILTEISNRIIKSRTASVRLARHKKLKSKVS